MNRLRFSIVALAICFPALLHAEPLKVCGGEVKPRPDGWVRDVIAKDKTLSELLPNAERLRFQVVVAEVVKTKRGLCLRKSLFRAGAEYTYPASAIKVVGAIAALREAQNHDGWSLDTPVRIPEFTRPNHEDRFVVSPQTETTLDELLEKTLVVSSNSAFNALYDIAGRQQQNALMHAAGLDSVRMWHRLSQTTAPQDAHAWAPAIEIMADEGWVRVRPVRGPNPAPQPTYLSGTTLGVGYVDAVTKSRVDAPMDFAIKNAISMEDLMATTVAIARPDLFGAEHPFGLSAANLEALRVFMTQRPDGASEAETLQREARFKPFSPGVLRAFGGDRGRFRYVNKAGRAYGFHLDSAYIEDVKTGRAFFLTATLWPNENQILNDNAYEYDDVSYPALQALGEVFTRELLKP